MFFPRLLVRTIVVFSLEAVCPQTFYLEKAGELAYFLRCMGNFQKSFVVLSLTAFLNIGFAADATLAKAKALEAKGEFKNATELLTEKLKDKDLSETARHDYEWEIDWMGRVQQDYGWTEETLRKRLNSSVKGVTSDEIDAWMKEGRFDGRKIDGEMRYTVTSVNNLFWRRPDLEPRRQPAKDNASYHRALLDTARRVKKAALEQKKPYVYPTHFQCTMTVTAEKNATENGEMIRAWLPVPRSYPFQTDFNLTGSSSPVRYLAHEESPIRSVYMEQTAVDERPTEFRINYDYVRNAVYFDLKPEEVRTGKLSADVLPFTKEAPHVVFTPAIRELANEIVGKEKNPLVQARGFYNWIAENIKYSYAREYSTLTNISDYCLSNGYGDCGQEGLLFITLCRSKGIPARWQTGWNLFPTHKGIHDWTEIYLAPYGWVPVDPWAGIYASRYCTNLSADERKELRDFYFGGLDQYRMSANSDHNQELQPPKHTFRSDDVDFQRGELEGSKNIYFDRYDYKLEVEEVPARK